MEDLIRSSLSAHGQAVNYGLARGWFGDNPQAGQVSGVVNNLLEALSGSRDYNNMWSAYQASLQREWSAEQAELARRYNTAEAAKNRDWQEFMSNTAHQREVRDLQAAGLNPVLSAMGGNGAAVTSGATASAVMPSGSTGGTDESMNSAIASILGTILNNQQRMTETMINARLTEAMTEKQIAANQGIAELNALTSRSNAQTAAGASMYGALQGLLGVQYSADKSFENAEAQRKWDAEHPNNLYQTIGSIAGLAGITEEVQEAMNLYGGFDRWIVDSTFGKNSFDWSRFWSDFNAASTEAGKQAVYHAAENGKYNK